MGVWVCVYVLCLWEEKGNLNIIIMKRTLTTWSYIYMYVHVLLQWSHHYEIKTCFTNNIYINKHQNTHKSSETNIVARPKLTMLEEDTGVLSLTSIVIKFNIEVSMLPKSV